LVCVQIERCDIVLIDNFELAYFEIDYSEVLFPVTME
jgi:hypothetical protein